MAIGAVVVLAAAGLTVFLLTRPADEQDAAGPTVPTISGRVPATSASAPAPPSGGVATGGGSTAVPGPPPPADDQTAAARTVVEGAISAINTQDVASMAELACDPAAVGQPEDVQQGVTAELIENPKVEGDKATAQVRLTIEGAGEPQVVPLPLEKRADGTWCVP
ncbi:hypothetical protein GCM10027436_30930 [Actinophytocola sediminis]